jgi:hypothetical protein
MPNDPIASGEEYPPMDSFTPESEHLLESTLDPDDPLSATLMAPSFVDNIVESSSTISSVFMKHLKHYLDTHKSSPPLILQSGTPPRTPSLLLSSPVESRYSVDAINLEATLDLLQIEEGRDYVLAENDRLPLSLIKNLGHGHSAIVEMVQDEQSGSVFARSVPHLQQPGRKAAHIRERDQHHPVSCLRAGPTETLRLLIGSQTARPSFPCCARVCYIRRKARSQTDTSAVCRWRGSGKLSAGLSRDQLSRCSEPLDSHLGLYMSCKRFVVYAQAKGPP